MNFEEGREILPLEPVKYMRVVATGHKIMISPDGGALSLVPGHLFTKTLMNKSTV